MITNYYFTKGTDGYYYIGWGDGELEKWLGPHDSGKEITINHIWGEK